MGDVRIPEWTTGDRLRKAREEAGIGVQQMADELGYGRESIHRWERSTGKRHGKPTRAVLMSYATLCRVPLEWLESGTATARYLASCLLRARAGSGAQTIGVARW